MSDEDRESFCGVLATIALILWVITYSIGSIWLSAAVGGAKGALVMVGMGLTYLLIAAVAVEIGFGRKRG